MKGSGGRFSLPSPTRWVQLGFQKSAYSDLRQLRFTVNLSVIDRQVWAAQAAQRPYLGTSPTPTVDYGSWADQTRIGLLTPDGRDLWWVISQDVDPAPVGDEAVRTVLGVGVPWLVARANPKTPSDDRAASEPTAR